MTQHVATRHNREAKRTQHVAPSNVVICWVEMLRSFGWGLITTFLGATKTGFSPLIIKITISSIAIVLKTSIFH